MNEGKFKWEEHDVKSKITTPSQRNKKIPCDSLVGSPLKDLHVVQVSLLITFN